MILNPLHVIDFYKTDHRRQYPEGTQYVYSNFTARSAKHAVNSGVVNPLFDNKVVFFGLQGFCKWFLQEVWKEFFFSRPRHKVLAAYAHRMDTSLGVGAITTDHIGQLWDVGYLPVLIRALPEGTKVPIGVPMFTIVNTRPEFFWLTNYLETALSNGVWKSCTVATIANEFHALFKRYASITGADPRFVPIQGHDFSYRGLGGPYDAAHSAAHLLPFIGTDTVAAIDYAQQYYEDSTVVGISVPATEHSVMCMGGKETEIETFRRLITEVYPSGIVSIVSDTWDFWKVINEYARELKDTILNRKLDSNGNSRVVFRPDSGDPVRIICGAPDQPAGSPARMGAVECLWNIFGGTVNDKGFKTLNPRVGLIYGDSITLQRASLILQGLRDKGFASDNIVFGIGSYTYQHVTRDTFGFAMKSTWGMVNGEPREIFKDPITDDGTKKSLRGLIVVSNTNGQLKALDRTEYQEALVLNPEFDVGEMKTVFYNGKVTGEKFRYIKERLLKGG